jgi:MoxR-like ATPase
LNADTLSSTFAAIQSEVGRVVVGQAALIEQVVVALLARGHVLIEGVPGVGKTLLVRALAGVLGAQFKRIQFTPDLMPTDVTGGNVFDGRKGEFSFVPGPVFTQLLLADEINRAPAKTQNPVESQGTYPLPEAQLDRFLLKLLVSHPERAVERNIVKNFVNGFDAARLAEAGLRALCEPQTVLSMQQYVATVRVDDELIDYVTDIVGRTRAHPSIYLGASPRGAIGLVALARAHAAVNGRDFVIPDDVKAYAAPALRHRIMLHPDAELSNVSADDCIESILREVPVPKGIA